MWNLKYGKNEPIYKAKTDSQSTDWWLPRGVGRKNWEFGLVVIYYINLLDG